MGVKVNVAVSTQYIEIDGEQVPVEWASKDGRFRAEWRGNVYIAAHPGLIQAQIQEIRDAEGVKMARARALRAAERSPIPAMLLPDLTPVGVRGIDKRTGYPLIVFDGRRDSVRASQLVRPLTDEEAQGVRNVVRASRDAEAALRGGPQPTSRYRAMNDLTVPVEATYDAERQMFEATYDGEHFEATGVYDLGLSIGGYIVRRDWPYALFKVGPGVLVIVEIEEFLAHEDNVPSAWGSDGLFKTREEAEQYLALTAALAKATHDEIAAISKYRLDLSAFED